MGKNSDLINQIKKGESKTLEFKEKLPNNNSIAKTIISFSNTSGGKLIVGIQDTGEISGIENENIFELQDKISSIIFDSIYPNVLPEIYTLNINSKLLLVIEAFRGNLMPYYLKSKGKNDGTYIRIGATNRKATYLNIFELERQRRNISFDEEICYDVDFQNLDLSPLYVKFKKIGKNLDEEKLKNLKLIKIENRKIYPTNALLILLGKFDHCSLKCARFKGTTMEFFIDKKEYNGDIFSMLENAQNFILNHINLKGNIKGLYRTDSYEIPPIALREALVNALVHRDYINGGRDIKVGIYDDIVNIVSPGSFPNSITAEDIENGRSEARNRVIANVFKELGLIEQWGSGIIRMKSLCVKEGLKEPKIQEQNDFVDVEFYRSQEEKIDNYDRLRPITTNYDRLKFEEKKILSYLLDNQNITRKDAIKLLDLGETKIKEVFNTLIKKDLIQREGQGRSTRYTLAGIINDSQKR